MSARLFFCRRHQRHCHHGTERRALSGQDRQQRAQTGNWQRHQDCFRNRPRLSGHNRCGGNPRCEIAPDHSRGERRFGLDGRLESLDRQGQSDGRFRRRGIPRDGLCRSRQCGAKPDHARVGEKFGIESKVEQPAVKMISLSEIQPVGTDLVSQVEEIFSSNGILSRASNFEFRPQQQEMAVAVARALQNHEHLAVEAGTGVGKSLAYLVPAILFAVAEKKKAIISTHTINLQEQLTEKDLPMLAGVLGSLPEPVKFSYAMLKGRANYLCTRRLQKAIKQSGNLFTSSEAEELQRIYDWSKTTRDGSLSDFDIEPDGKVWAQVCSERGLCSPKICGYQSDFGKDHGICFFQRARNKILSSDVLVLNHTLFFTLLGGVDEDIEGGILFKNDFVIFDEAHTMEGVASRHIGLSVSSGQVRYSLNRLWNPRTEKGLLATLRQGPAVKLVADILNESDKFFENVETACEEIQAAAKPKFGGGGNNAVRRRAW